MKRERIFLAMAGLLLGFVVSGCREPNPAYIKARTDGAVSKDTAVPEDRPVDSNIPDTNTVQRDTAVPNDASIDTRDAPVDQPRKLDGADSLPLPSDALDGGEEADGLGADGPGATRDVLPDTGSARDTGVLADGPYDAVGSPDGTDGASLSDTGIPILDSPILDSSPDGPGAAVDAAQGIDGPEGDALDDGGLERDGDLPDTTS